MTTIQELAPPDTSSRKPSDDELDVFGITNRGKVRPENQDHFLIGSLRKRISIRQSSLPELSQIPLGEERVASFIMVADGVGGGLKGEQASRMTLEVATKYLSEGARCYYRFDEDVDLAKSLEEGARKCHQAIQERAASDENAAGMATTLSLFIAVWPWIYHLQVGDSRFYQYHEGVLRQVSRDQTLAQEMADQGIMSPELARKSPLTNVLSSSIGGHQSAPVVTKISNDWNLVNMVCSDGLTKHVPDSRIAERLGAMSSARQVCEDLVQDALDSGGTDNITVCVARAIPKG